MNIVELVQNKTSEEAIFFGCGPSVGHLEEKECQLLQQRCDLWASNNFFIHNLIVPNFYHLEVKAHRNGSLVKDVLNKKIEQGQYRDTKWVLDITRPYLLEYLSEKVHKNAVFYHKIYRGDGGAYTPDPRFVSVSCGASLTVVLDVMSRMKYRRVAFLGVDLYSSEYFWTDNIDYKSVDIPKIMRTCKPDERKPKDPHPTLKTAKFIAEFAIYNDIEFVNLSKDSILSQYLPTMTVSDFLSNSIVEEG